MKDFIANIKHQIESEIKIIEIQEKDKLHAIKNIVRCIEMSLIQIKSFLFTFTFNDQQDEIFFFKVLKPEIYSRLLFYVRLYEIESRCLDKPVVEQQMYISKELQRLIRMQECPGYFGQYYRSGRTDLDNQYFVRESYDVLQDPAGRSLEHDRSFSTGRDYEVADIMANDRLKNELSARMKELDANQSYQIINLLSDGRTQWTGSKAALVELVYALYACGHINRGEASLKDIANCVSIFFRMELGDFYRVFLEIRERKGNRTRFLDDMRDKLIKVMDGLDK